MELLVTLQTGKITKTVNETNKIVFPISFNAVMYYSRNMKESNIKHNVAPLETGAVDSKAFHYVPPLYTFIPFKHYSCATVNA